MSGWGILENHMVFDSPDAPWNAEDDDREWDRCLNCGRELYLTGDDWETYEGSERPEAGEYDEGFFCCEDCHNDYVAEHSEDGEDDAN